jgi:molybdopterin/thiamine biosynthesis adenylyltransferase
VLSELGNPEDLKQLIQQDYSISIVGAHLIVNDVYYVDAHGDLGKGRLAAPLNLTTPNTLGAPVNHQMYWSESDPYFTDGTRIPTGDHKVNISIGSFTFPHHLSIKPTGGPGFVNYFEMIEHYVSLISAPAEQKFGVSARTAAVYDCPPGRSPFTVPDTFSARAQIDDLNALLTRDQIVIIGLGGTGAYVLDFLVKTPVATITAYDFDTLKVHNGFRMPGEVPIANFGLPKSEIYQRKYSSFRRGLVFHNKRIDASDTDCFNDTTFAFVCIDDGPSRAEICEMLRRAKVPFIDVGMGVEKENGSLDGIIRTTLFTPETAEAAMLRVPTDSRDEANAYRTYVQIAELNALNAALAVIRYKQLRGFYADDHNYFNLLDSIAFCSRSGESDAIPTGPSRALPCNNC